MPFAAALGTQTPIRARGALFAFSFGLAGQAGATRSGMRKGSAPRVIADRLETQTQRQTVLRQDFAGQCPDRPRQPVLTLIQ